MPVAGRAPIVERILAVTDEEVQRVGADHVRMSEVAERAGVSRATLYRYFANKQVLITAYTMRELDIFIAGVDEAMEPHDGTSERLTAAFTWAIPAMREHPLIGLPDTSRHQLLRETLQSGEVLSHARDLIAKRINAAVRAGRVDIDQFGVTVFSEMMARTMLSMIATPASILRLETVGDARDFATQYVLPMLTGQAVFADREKSAGG